MSETTHLRGLDRDLLEQVRRRYPGRTHGSLVNQAMKSLLSQQQERGALLGNLVVMPSEDPGLDLRSLDFAALPEVSLSDDIMANR